MARARQFISHAWDLFQAQRVNPTQSWGWGPSFAGSRPDRTRIRVGNDRSILTSIIVRLAVDVAMTNVRHCRVDENGKYLNDIDSGLNNCITLEANIDQNAFSLFLDIATTMFSEGAAAVVPVTTSEDPTIFGSFDIKTMRVGRIVDWYPQHIRVDLYNERTGMREQIVVPKRTTAICENPLYSIMNEPNGTLQRVLRKLSMLDVSDDRVASGKLDLLMQFPFQIKSESRRQHAEQRRADLEAQLSGSTYGIGWVDSTEKVIQLNRALENNLLAEIELLMKALYGQLGVTEDIMNGTATGDAMVNYYNRSLNPIHDVIALEFKRKFLTKTGRTQGQSILYFRDILKLVPLTDLGDLFDVLSRNEIATPNDLRQSVGWKPSTDPKADMMQNSNMPQPNGDPAAAPADAASPDASAAFDQIDSTITQIFKDLNVPEGAPADANA